MTRFVGILLVCFFCRITVADQSLEKIIRPMIDGHQGEVAVAIKNLVTGDSVEFRSNQPMPTASLIKFPLMVAAYDAKSRGQLDFAKAIKLTDGDKVPGSGVLTSHFSSGTTLSLRDAVHLMMVYSDNTATNLVVDQVGLSATAKLMQSLGFPNTKLHSKVFRRDTSIFPDRSREFGLGSTTADEIVRLLEQLYRRELVSQESSDRMLEHMLACESRNQIPRLLPKGAKVAHKSGAISSVRCDAGIVYAGEDQAFAICVLTRKNNDQSWGDDNKAELLVADIASAAWDHYYPDEPVESGAAAKLKIGAGGVLVESLQRTLNARMDPSPGLSVDGDFGPNTQAAVVRFQKTNQLTALGEMDAATWSALGILIGEEAVPDPAVVNAERAKKQPADELRGPPHVTCRAWAIGDAATGRLLWGEAENTSLPMASTTKIMTAHVVLQMAAKDPDLLEQSITFSQTADNTTGSSCRIRAGESIQVRELLYGLLLPSGNDASVALAEHFGSQLTNQKADEKNDPGTAYERFVSAMNQRAIDLGLDKTQFRNTHGLTEEGHHASARDLMTLAWHAMKDPIFCECVTTSQRGCTVTGPGGYQRNLLWRNTNRLLEIEGFDGVKTGTTSAAGSCLVSRGNREGVALFVVVLGSSSSDARYADTRNLYRWAFQQQSSDLTQAAVPRN